MVIVGVFLSPPRCCEPRLKRIFKASNTAKSISTDRLEAMADSASFGPAAAIRGPASNGLLRGPKKTLERIIPCAGRIESAARRRLIHRGPAAMRRSSASANAAVPSPPPIPRSASLEQRAGRRPRSEGSRRAPLGRRGRAGRRASRAASRPKAQAPTGSPRRARRCRGPSRAPPARRRACRRACRRHGPGSGSERTIAEYAHDVWDVLPSRSWLTCPKK